MTLESKSVMIDDGSISYQTQLNSKYTMGMGISALAFLSFPSNLNSFSLELLRYSINVYEYMQG